MKTLWASRPTYIVLLTWATVFVLRALPIATFHPLTNQVCILLTGGAALYLLGFFLGRNLPLLPMRHSRVNTPSLREKQAHDLGKYVAVLAIIGALGALMRACDFLFLRGLDYSAGIGAARLANMQLVEEVGKGTNYLSALGRALIGFSSVAAMIAFLRFEQLPWKVSRLALMSFAFVLGASALEGGRNTIAVNFLFIAACAITRKSLFKKALPDHSKLRRLIKIGLLLALALMSYIWIDRMSAIGHESQDVTSAIEALFDMQFADWINQMEMDSWGSFIFTLVGIVFYFIHGLNEMNWLVSSLQFEQLSWGAYNFDLPTLAIQAMTGWNIRFDINVLERQGIYMTAIGELFIDFGFVGTLIALLVIGYFMGSVWYRMKRGESVSCELLNAWGIAAILASPLYSIISGFFNVLGVMLIFSVVCRARTGTPIPAPFVQPHLLISKE